MTIVEAQNAGTSFITVRGLSQVRNGESPVAISVDGVLQISPNQFNVDLFDIAQIEVLKGPQGALYGRNAIGGAINIILTGATGGIGGSILNILHKCNSNIIATGTNDNNLNDIKNKYRLF